MSVAVDDAVRTVCLGLSAGHTGRDGQGELEQVLDRVVEDHGGVVLACTHVVDGTWVGSVEITGPAPDPARLASQLGVTVAVHGGTSAGDQRWTAAAGTAAAGLAARTDGRAVHFGGRERLVGEIDTDDVTSLSAVAEVVGIAGTPTAGTRLVTRDFVRPRFVDGRLVLHVRPWGTHGTVAPFEVPDPVPCCANH